MQINEHTAIIAIKCIRAYGKILWRLKNGRSDSEKLVLNSEIDAMKVALDDLEKKNDTA